uniref:Uncharacterized protein n=1 Tax=Candidatus Kentrum sp. TC TaxID=2126339 RepID=A0A450Z5X0_9GAMM|nr:MAG: hypothetical protein BECKTC1821D_GA0114238_10722 [Candidatus Kentron sp. TC]
MKNSRGCRFFNRKKHVHVSEEHSRVALGNRPGPPRVLAEPDVNVSILPALPIHLFVFM